MTAVPSVGVVVLAWGTEPHLAECVESVLASTGVEVSLVLVDNGARPDDMARVRTDRLELVEPGHNTGFAGGCNLGAAKLETDFVAFVNSDCLLHADALAQLAAEAADPGTGPVMASIRLADRPELINSAGNPVHLVGLSWAGGIYRPETRSEPYDVTGASGACLLLRRELWDELGGFDDAYFAYVEDTELSLRAWRRGLAARCVPTALALHHYEFSRNPQKMYLLERNRLMLVGTLWSRRALLVLAPVLLGTELLLTAYAIGTGWGGQKARGWAWLWTHRRHVLQRRRAMAQERRVPDAVWMRRLSPQLDPQVIGPALLTRAANVVLRAYWALARRLL